MPEYYAVVRDLTQRAQMPMPKLYVTPDMQPNAFATGRNPDHAAVAVTQGILEICTWDELRGVLAHEISHVGNRDILIGSVAATIAMAITFAARLAMFAAIFGGGNDRGGNRGPNVFEHLALIILAPLAATLLQMALSRSREYEADRSGARLIGDGEPLARALAKLEAAAKRIPMRTCGPRWPRCTSSTRCQPGRASSSSSGTCSRPTRRPRTASPGSGPRSGLAKRRCGLSAVSPARVCCMRPSCAGKSA